MNNGELKLNIAQLLSALSLALDIAENRSFEHSRRTAYISYNIAKNMGLNEDLIEDIYYSAFIHDIGMAGQLTSYSIYEIHDRIKLRKEHCEIGANIVRFLPFKKDISDFVLYHHEEWNGGGVFGLKGDEIPIGSQVIHVADYFDLNYGSELKREIDIDNVKKWVASRKGEDFSPEVADSFLNIMDRESFWFDLRFYNFQQVLDTIAPRTYRRVNIPELKQISKAFAALIDSKSRFTYEHSIGVVEITKKIAQYMGYDDTKYQKLEIAAYLHDLGKLIVSNEILDKPSKLTKEEFEIIKAHPYYTKIILKQVKGLEDIANWAGNHHEKLDGTGYPERLNYRDLTDEDQIIAIADIYQALTEDRPYRKGMFHKEAVSILDSMVKKGAISEKIVKILDKAMLE